MWVIVIYKEEKWIGKVVTKGHDQVCVRSLENLCYSPASCWREKKIPFISARSITVISHQISCKWQKSGSVTTNWLLFALVFLAFFFFFLFLKLVISLLLKNLKSLSWSLCNLNSPDYQVSESCTPYTYLYMLYVSKLLNPLCIRHLRV